MASRAGFCGAAGTGSGMAKNFNALVWRDDQKTAVTGMAVSVPGPTLRGHANYSAPSAMEGGDADGKAKPCGRPTPPARA